MLAIAAHKGLAAYALGASIVESGVSRILVEVVVLYVGNAVCGGRR